MKKEATSQKQLEKENQNLRTRIQELEDSFGMLVGEIIGKTDYDLHNKDKADLFHLKDKIVIEQLRPHRNEEWSTSPDGRKVFLDTYKAPLYTKGGASIDILGISRDVKLQKIKEDELIKAHEQLLSVMDAFDEPAYVADPVTYELLFANNSIQKNMGNDIIGKKCYQALQNFDSPCPFCTNHLIFGNKLGKTHIWEVQNSKNNRWYRCIDKAIEWPDGRMVRFELAIDIHKEKMSQKALQESEEKYRTYVNIAPHPIFVIDSYGNYVDVNPAACKVTGYSRKEILKMDLADLFTHTDKSYYLKLCESLQFEGNLSGEVSVIKKEGKIIYLEVQVVRIPGNRFLALCTDITEKKKIEDEILQTKIAAENANRTKSEFLANMSHELRTPLNSVIGFADILLNGIAGEINDKQHGYISNISRSGRHLLNIINEILDISKIESGKMKLYKENVPLIEIFKEIVATLQHLADDKNIDLKVSSYCNEKYAYADRAKLKQILYNLAGNAIKFTENGGSVTINANVKDEFIHISVVDTGIGIDLEGLKKLFKPFMQLDSSEARKYEGTGLGLALSRELVELHGGTIWAESEQGQGSTFTFTIPICK
ncbi:PAS domain-containing sensor histidine kinase [Methanolobus psychrotolerans]|uniref:PAS domain-containing sensor histidine kinase n=1 Tax=Methanolobus psychrotolerans TaxID=1874706 RepID=UPI000B91C504|nr:ATP-binding protein [Methanolobus psychrotolerans]